MKTRAILFLGAVLLVFSGCGRMLPRREMRDLQPVRTLGCDTVPGGVVLSVSSGSGPEGEPPVRLAAEGESLARAAENARNFSPRAELFFAHTAFALAGEDAARAGLEELLDWFLRSTQTRLDVPLFVVRDNTARIAVILPDGDGEITGVLAALRQDAERSGRLRCYTVLEISRQLARSGTALCAAVRLAEAAENLPDGESPAAVLDAGCAVLKDGRLAGWLDPSAARGVELLKGRAGALEYTLEDGEGTVTAALRRCRIRLERGPDGDLLVLLQCRAGITGTGGTGELAGERLRSMENRLAGAAAADCAAALAGERETGTDFLELTALLRPGEPLTAELRTETARDLRWNLSVRATLDRSYDTDAPLPLSGETGRG